MRIVEIRDAVAPISSPIRNAFIDFSKMTISVLAIVTDVMRDGEPIIGYGFHSNGRYAQQGILRTRLIPRLMEADPTLALGVTKLIGLRRRRSGDGSGRLFRRTAGPPSPPLHHWRGGEGGAVMPPKTAPCPKK